MGKLRNIFLIYVTFTFFVIIFIFSSCNIITTNPPFERGSVAEDNLGEDDSNEIVSETGEESKNSLNFTCEDTGGNKVSLSDFIGKVVVVNVWG